MAPPEISFGILLIPFQALDVIGPMDILQNIGYQSIAAFISQSLADSTNAPNITFHYIGPTMDPVASSANLHIQPTTTLTECPPLDYLIIGGPLPTYAASLPSDMKDFIISRSKEVKTIFTTCTGGLVLAATGLIDGIAATANHTIISVGREISPTTKWDNQNHWVISQGEGDVTFWTAAGAGAGMDMMAEWVRQTFGQVLLDQSTMMLEWQPRDVNGKPQRYMNGRGEQVEI